MFEGEYSNFIFLEPEGFIFSYVAKVACTNWKCLLRQKLGYADWLDPHLAHDRSRSGLPYLNTHADPLSIIESPEIKKYTMVRNPYSRVLSAFLNRLRLITHSRCSKVLMIGMQKFLRKSKTGVAAQYTQTMSKLAFPCSCNGSHIREI